MSDESKIFGRLTQIRFHRDGFLIGQLHDGTAVKGSMTTPQLESCYHFQGKWIFEPRWGKTFVFASYKREEPKSPEAIRLYLEANAPWIGPVLARKIVEQYQHKTLEILKVNPHQVPTDIPGITEARALDISRRLLDLEEFEELELSINEVLGDDVSDRIRHKIIDRWGLEAANQIRENPYALIELIDGIGFLTADKIAQRVGFHVEGYPRIRAGVLHVLKEAAWGEGHTYLPRNMLVLRARGILRMNPEKIDAVIPQMVQETVIVVQGDAVYLPDIHRDEVHVAERLKEMVAAQKD